MKSCDGISYSHKWGLNYYQTHPQSTLVYVRVALFVLVPNKSLETKDWGDEEYLLLPSPLLAVSPFSSDNSNKNRTLYM
jgi:hypothetical protein